MMRILLYIALALILYVSTEQLVEKQTRGFGVNRIQAKNLNLFLHCENDPLLATSPVLKLLKQPYHLIGSGSECFAFVSEDGTAVIKFFKLDLMRPVYIKRVFLSNQASKYTGSWETYHPRGFLWDGWLQKLWSIREYRIKRSFNSVQIAYKLLKEETGLLYTHLNEGDEFDTPLTVYDGCHIAHQIDLNTTRFVLQKRAIPLPQYLDSLTNVVQAQESIDSLIDLIYRRCLRAVQDRDLEPRNFGYVEGRAIEIDTGSFSQDEREQNFLAQFRQAAQKLKQPFQERFPYLSSYFDTQVEKCALELY